jgi:hypothetical protein
MPTVSETARATTRRGAVWRACRGCGTLAALPPDIDRCGECVKADELTGLADFLDRADLAEIGWAGSVFAAALAEVTHHEIGDPGTWDCYSRDPLAELLRLRAAMARVDAAIRQARRELTAIERRARAKATRARRTAGQGVG